MRKYYPIPSYDGQYHTSEDGYVLSFKKVQPKVLKFRYDDCGRKNISEIVRYQSWKYLP